MWCFPGGAPEEGEDTSDTIIREAYEEYELRLEKKNCRLLLKYPSAYDASSVEHAYVCEIDGEQKPILHEGADMKWMTLEEIYSLELGFGHEALLEPLRVFLKR